VTIPNGKLADQQTESYAARDRLFMSAPLRLVYGTSAAQIRDILREVEAALRQQPKLFPDGITVRFVGWSESSLNVEVSAWFNTTDWNEFMVIRQELLLRFMEIVERAGSAFAFPSRTVYLQQPAHRQPQAVVPLNSQPAGDT
jgi:MscS family membrane protein